jgi:Uma2 family endonuclease
MSPLPAENSYTYADLLTWDDDIRYELHYGQPVALASPSEGHQRVLTGLLIQIGSYLEGKRCRVYPAPLDVRLFEQAEEPPEDVDTVVQPDLMVVCDPDKADRRGIHGAPDLVVEILSDSTRRVDRLVKYQLYQRAGVPEYWIVDPAGKTVAVHRLQDGQYGSPDLYLAGDTVPVSVLEDCTIDLTRIFGS